MKLTGTILYISEEVVISDKLSKKIFVIEHGNEYPRKAAFDLLGDKMIMIESYQVNDRVTVHFNIDSRKYTRKDGTNAMITALQPYRVDKYDTDFETAQNNPADSNAGNYEKAVNTPADKKGDLPF